MTSFTCIVSTLAQLAILPSPEYTTITKPSTPPRPAKHLYQALPNVYTKTSEEFALRSLEHYSKLKGKYFAPPPPSLHSTESPILDKHQAKYAPKPSQAFAPSPHNLVEVCRGFFLLLMLAYIRPKGAELACGGVAE